MEAYSIKWQDKFNTGVNSVDKQHKKLFELLSIFASAYLMGEEKNIVSEFLFELEDYAHLHFKDEEQQLITKGIIPSEKHIGQHQEFKKLLRDLKFDYVSEDTAISSDLFDFLSTWLQDHIMGIDQEEFQRQN